MQWFREWENFVKGKDGGKWLTEKCYSMQIFYLTVLNIYIHLGLHQCTREKEKDHSNLYSTCRNF